MSFFRSLPLLLPAVEEGIFNDNWRIRQSSVELLGDLLFKVRLAFLTLILGPSVMLSSDWLAAAIAIPECAKFVSMLLGIQVAGTSGKVVLEGGSDDEGASTEAHGRAIVDILGKERRNEVLAAVYMVRSDVSLTVRQVPLCHIRLSLLQRQIPGQELYC